ncbi:MAG TPA: exodeoxyribonuclease VII large subunit, partial [Chromatiales bacterium]|nr:exodeoxyribonuclease VII large subunit [Chromatiales bacterium]
MPQPGPNDPILTVSELNREARELLEASFPALWVEGEISNFIHHSSGHMYFDLKDDRAQIRCAMFRGANRRLKFQPGNGDQVLLNGRLTLYEARGSFQLVVEHMEAAGEGLLRQRFEQLRARLEAEGLFSLEHKRTLPELPRCIGV